ncbi:2-dehydropantoate 2-reductase [Azospirillum halopraeferens]|uniref:2-dehydropantoate 2-reductase n=1 Tax=Azospirillum halopraeferens TaxID=34010 RepID=UPI00040118E9|nr:2-dehydropantoate 2-reductase [Azospirillum halopraeferens]
MRIAVMGSGGVGGYFGARLAAAGADVTFLARGRHLAAILNGGMRVVSGAGDLHLERPAATDDPAAVGPVDVVLFCVKLWDTESAAALCRPLLKPDTAVITLQNGVTGIDVLTAALGRDHVAGGVAHIAATIAAPGTIHHTGTLARMTFGEMDGRRSARLEAFRAVADRAGFDAILSDDILCTVWEKFAFLAPLSGLTALTRQPLGVVRAVPDTRALFEEAVAEVAAVAAARGVQLGPDIEERVMALVDALMPEMRSSMLNDLERGGRLELPWLSGAVTRLGAELGVTTPVHRVIAAALAPYADGPPRHP